MKANKVQPMDKRTAKNDKKAFGKTEKTIKPVAKDTNKTRRPNKLDIGTYKGDSRSAKNLKRPMSKPRTKARDC